jgi:hypothetical protein
MARQQKKLEPKVDIYEKKDIEIPKIDTFNMVTFRITGKKVFQPYIVSFYRSRMEEKIELWESQGLIYKQLA